MREIKFRAFCEAETNVGTLETMLYFKHCELDNGLWFNPEKDIYHINEWLSKPMQYTGLKDKNGKDIYEGDVLDNDNVVLWSNEQACFFCGQVPLCMSNSHREIIGNIHQNPELLK